MSCPDPKPGKTLNLETAEKVNDLYESEEISLMMPGKKRFNFSQDKWKTRACSEKN